MLSTLLLYPRCPECGDNLPFVSRYYTLRARDSFRRMFGHAHLYTELTVIDCRSCGANFSVTERGFALVVVGLIAVGGIAFLGQRGSLGSGAVPACLLGASLLVLFVLSLLRHRMTKLNLLPRPGETARDTAEVEDVYAQLEARDAQIKRKQDEQRAIRKAAETGVVNCPRCGMTNAEDGERCVNCDAVLVAPS